MGKKYKLVLWGLGRDYNRLLNLLKYEENAGEIEIVAITANDVPNVKLVDGWPVVKKEKLSTMHFDYVLVMNDRYYSDIVEEVMQLGISRKKIIPCRVLDIPYFNWQVYIDLLESNISIVSNNCWGGILYQTLGMECRSPFKNLAVMEEDFLQILTDLPYYLSKKPCMDRWERDPHSNQLYPLMKIDDVEIHFNHDTDIDAALEKWNRRCKLINYNNLFISIYTENDDVVERFLKLEQYPKKICFIPYKEDHKRWRNVENVYELELLPEQKEFWETVNSNVTNKKNSILIDILGILSMNKKYRVERC